MRYNKKKLDIIILEETIKTLAEQASPPGRAGRAMRAAAGPAGGTSGFTTKGGFPVKQVPGEFADTGLARGARNFPSTWRQGPGGSPGRWKTPIKDWPGFRTATYAGAEEAAKEAAAFERFAKERARAIVGEVGNTVDDPYVVERLRQAKEVAEGRWDEVMEKRFRNELVDELSDATINRTYQSGAPGAVRSGMQAMGRGTDVHGVSQAARKQVLQRIAKESANRVGEEALARGLGKKAFHKLLRTTGGVLTNPYAMALEYGLLAGWVWSTGAGLMMDEDSEYKAHSTKGLGDLWDAARATDAPWYTGEGWGSDPAGRRARGYGEEDGPTLWLAGRDQGVVYNPYISQKDQIEQGQRSAADFVDLGVMSWSEYEKLPDKYKAPEGTGVGQRPEEWNLGEEDRYMPDYLKNIVTNQLDPDQVGKRLTDKMKKEYAWDFQAGNTSWSMERQLEAADAGVDLEMDLGGWEPNESRQREMKQQMSLATDWQPIIVGGACLNCHEPGAQRLATHELEGMFTPRVQEFHSQYDPASFDTDIRTVNPEYEGWTNEPTMSEDDFESLMSKLAGKGYGGDVVSAPPLTPPQQGWTSGHDPLYDIVGPSPRDQLDADLKKAKKIKAFEEDPSKSPGPPVRPTRLRESIEKTRWSLLAGISKK